MNKPPRKTPPRRRTHPGAAPAAGGERIAKVLARRGVASRRTAEEMIAAGRVAVNGRVIASPALNVRASDRIEVDGRPLPEPAPPRLWLYHKPVGLVTTERDEKGRPTVFSALPPELGRVMSVGRLDITSEGLLLLTNDGALKRRLELPSTGWLRKYRVRVNGRPDEAALEPLRRGIVVDGERFQPMEVTIDRQQGANAWLTVGLREGRNREVRRAMEAVGLVVNRLIRISYGPFRLGGLEPGAVEEVRPKVLRDQLGLAATPAEGRPQAEGKAGPRDPRTGRKAPASRSARPGGAAAAEDRGGPPRRDARGEGGAQGDSRAELAGSGTQTRHPAGQGQQGQTGKPRTRGKGVPEGAAVGEDPRAPKRRPQMPAGGSAGRDEAGRAGGRPKARGTGGGSSPAPPPAPATGAKRGGRAGPGGTATGAADRGVRGQKAGGQKAGGPRRRPAKATADRLAGGMPATGKGPHRGRAQGAGDASGADRGHAADRSRSTARPAGGGPDGRGGAVPRGKRGPRGPGPGRGPNRGTRGPRRG